MSEGLIEIDWKPFDLEELIEDFKSGLNHLKDQASKAKTVEELDEALQLIDEAKAIIEKALSESPIH